MIFFAQIIGRMNKHSSAAACRIVNRVTWSRLQDANERVHDFGRGEELSGLCAGVVGKLFDEIFVSSTEHVRRDALVRKIVFVKMLDESMHDLVRNKGLP